MRYRQDCKEIGDRGGTLGPPPPHPPLFGAKKNFPCKIGKHKVFTCEERVRLCFIYWTQHKWQKLDSFFEFIILTVNWAIPVANSEFVGLCF